MTTESTCCLRREEIGPCAASSATLRNSSPLESALPPFRDVVVSQTLPRVVRAHAPFTEWNCELPLLSATCVSPSASRSRASRAGRVVAGRGHPCAPCRPGDRVTTTSSLRAGRVGRVGDRHQAAVLGVIHLTASGTPVPRVSASGRVCQQPLRARRAQARRVPGLLGLRQRRNSELAALFPPGSPSFSLSDPALCLWRRAFKRANARDGDTLVASAWAPPCCPELPAPPDARGIQPRRFRTEASAKFSALFILSSCEQVRIMMDCEQIALPCFFRP